MQNRSAIWIFTILLVIACLYQISFSFFTGGVEDEAKIAAQNSLNDYLLQNGVTEEDFSSGELDSLESKFESDYFVEHADDNVFLGFNYQECKDREMKLGLDLQGGMNVTLEVSLPELVINFADNSSSKTFRDAIAKARDYQRTENDDFITLFERAWNDVAPEKKMAAVFHNRAYKEKFSQKATNDEIIAILRTEAEVAITNTERILRTRIDRFGVTQPTIQRQGFSGRILIELPGVKDQRRVRKILQSTAKLEFWETYDNKDLNLALGSIDSFWKATLYPEDGTQTGLLDDAGDAASTPDSVPVVNPEAIPQEDQNLTVNDLLGDAGAEVDTTAPDSTKVTGGDSTSAEDDLLGGTNTAGDSTDPTANPETLTDEQRARANPLFAKLIPALYQTEVGLQWETGCRLGSVLIKDTAEVYDMLMDPRVQRFFPDNGKNLRLLWDAKSFNNYVSIYCIKVPKGGEAELTGDVITQAAQDFDPIDGGVEVRLNMNGEGAEIWAEITERSTSHAVVIALDDQVYSAPIVNGKIPNGSTSISMGNSSDNPIAEAKDLANILKAGSLPAPAKIVDEAVVGPTLGAENVEAGLMSFMIALGVVLLYMIFYYAKAGLISNVALIANIFFLIGALASMQASLTLPGIAGIVLTIGMSVDANVLIYERIREEIRAGKGMRLAITDGYKRAYAAIIDANLTTLLTGFVLFFFGSGPIKGFATTLIIGIFTSLFSAIFITRLIFVYQLERKKNISFANSMTKNWMTNVNIGWIAKRKVFYAISGLIVVGGIVSLTTQGLNLGVDFTGGRTFKVEFADQHAVNVTDLNTALTAQFINEDGTPASLEVKTIKNDYTVKVTTNFMLDNETQEADSIVIAHLDAGMADYSQAETVLVESRKVEGTISDDIKTSALWAVVFSLIIIFLYILFRFRKWQFGMGALLAMSHDVLVVLAAFSIFYTIMPFSMEVDQAFIAAILTVVGYSINDTVVVFDRIREYLALYSRRDTKEVVNDALNSTLSRTVNTSMSTFVVLLMIFIFGGESIKGFAFALMLGVVVGTYSSLCIATPSAVDLAKNLKPEEKKAEE